LSTRRFNKVLTVEAVQSVLSSRMSKISLLVVSSLVQTTRMISHSAFEIDIVTSFKIALIYICRFIIRLSFTFINDKRLKNETHCKNQSNLFHLAYYSYSSNSCKFGHFFCQSFLARRSR